MSALHKIVFIGPAKSGKTALLEYFKTKKFNEQTKPTIGFDFYTYFYTYKTTSDIFQIRDFSGQQPLSSQLLSGAKAILIACDLSDAQLEEHMTAYLDKVKGLLPAGVPVILVGTKMFMSTSKTMTAFDKIIPKCLSYGIKKPEWIHTRADTGQGVADLFEVMLPAAVSRYTPAQIHKAEEDKGIDDKEIQDSLLSNKPKSSSGKGSNNWLINHLQAHSWQYAIGTLLMLATIAVFAIPGVLPAAFIGLLASSSLGLTGALALLGTLAALLTFFTPLIIGHTLKLLGAIVEAAVCTAEKLFNKRPEASLTQTFYNPTTTPTLGEIGERKNLLKCKSSYKNLTSAPNGSSAPSASSSSPPPLLTG